MVKTELDLNTTKFLENFWKHPHTGEEHSMNPFSSKWQSATKARLTTRPSSRQVVFGSYTFDSSFKSYDITRYYVHSQPASQLDRYTLRQ